MLERLLIKQFAIIEGLEIDFVPPFTVLTGETGAGKSILIDAVAILLGGRAQSEMIRHGAERAYVEGVFSFQAEHPVYQQLAEEGWAEAGERTFVLRRELSVSGKNPCRINGCTVSLAQYRQLALGLLDIHGQHDYQQLMQTQKQLDILDAFGGLTLLQIKKQVQEAYDDWKSREKKLREGRQNQQAFAAKRDFLQYQVKEIDEAKVRAGEETELEGEIQRLTHSQRILKSLNKAHQVLFDADEGASAYDLLSKALHYLRDLGKYDPELTGIYDRLEPVSYLLDETSREIQQYKESLEHSPEHLEEAENRLYLLRTLGKKYGATTLEILAHRQKAATELAEMEEFFSHEEKWAAGEEAARESYHRLADQLHGLREKTKTLLEERIDGEFKDLAMANAHFSVALGNQMPSAAGKDNVEFLISTNVGEPFLPLAKIASGGELSRITLAMKGVLASLEACESMIFDEIDSGIGGFTAQTVAEKLFAISHNQQVICVTHAAGIAAKANQHFLLEKEEVAGRTLTKIKELTEEERVDELARMLGGSASEDLRRHARSLLN